MERGEKRSCIGAVWALPCAEQTEVLKACIGRLAARFAGPSFLPHLTVLSGEFPLLPGEHELAAWADDWPPFALGIKGIEHHHEFFRCVVAACGLTAEFQQRWEHMRATVGSIEAYELYPHVSLLYGTLERAQRSKAAVDVGPLPVELRFDRLAFVYPASGRWTDVDAWRTSALVTLRRPVLESFPAKTPGR